MMRLEAAIKARKEEEEAEERRKAEEKEENRRSKIKSKVVTISFVELKQQFLYSSSHNFSM